MITTINEYKQFLEELNPDINSDKSIQLKEYESDMIYYKANISKLDNILSLSDDKWEDEANKIINTNKYLGHYWKIAKMNKKSEDMEERIKSSELTEEEKKSMQEELSRIDADKIILQRELDKDIKDDLDNLKKL